MKFYPKIYSPKKFPFASSQTLQKQNIVQAKTIVVHEQELKQIKTNLLQITQDIAQVEEERKTLLQREQKQSLEISRLEGNITFLEEEREKQDAEMRQFLDKYEEQALNWKMQLEEKDKELQLLRKHQSELSTTSLKMMQSSTSSSVQSQQDEELIRLRHVSAEISTIDRGYLSNLIEAILHLQSQPTRCSFLHSS